MVKLLLTISITVINGTKRMKPLLTSSVLQKSTRKVLNDESGSSLPSYIQRLL